MSSQPERAPSIPTIEEQVKEKSLLSMNKKLKDLFDDYWDNRISRERLLDRVTQATNEALDYLGEEKQYQERLGKR